MIQLRSILLGLLLFCLSMPLHAQQRVVVAQDGSGDYSKIQEAVDAARDLGPPLVVHIRNGVYQENLEIPSWKRQLTLIGESREGTIIRGDRHAGQIGPNGKPYTTFDSHTVLVAGDDIHIKSLTIENTSCDRGQAVALHVEGDRFIAEDCTISGCQDSLYAGDGGSRQYYVDCLVEGTTDFIFGQATAVFERCEIRSLKDSYITAAATPRNQDFGLVFLGCRLTAGEGVSKVYLGRPWRPHAKTVLINSELGGHIRPQGWHPWPGDPNYPDKEKTAYFAEYNSRGEGARPDLRVSWSRQLSNKELKKYSVENMFKGWYPLKNN